MEFGVDDVRIHCFQDSQEHVNHLAPENGSRGGEKSGCGLRVGELKGLGFSDWGLGLWV